jgi:hypothetical protein
MILIIQFCPKFQFDMLSSSVSIRTLWKLVIFIVQFRPQFQFDRLSSSVIIRTLWKMVMLVIQFRPQFQFNRLSLIKSWWVNHYFFHSLPNYYFSRPKNMIGKHVNASENWKISALYRNIEFFTRRYYGVFSLQSSSCRVLCRIATGACYKNHTKYVETRYAQNVEVSWRIHKNCEKRL